LGFLFRKLKQEFFQLYLYNYQTTIIPTKWASSPIPYPTLPYLGCFKH
jgi:hypothetical protein